MSSDTLRAWGGLLSGVILVSLLLVVRHLDLARPQAANWVLLIGSFVSFSAAGIFAYSGLAAEPERRTARQLQIVSVLAALGIIGEVAVAVAAALLVAAFH